MGFIRSCLTSKGNPVKNEDKAGVKRGFNSLKRKRIIMMTYSAEKIEKAFLRAFDKRMMQAGVPPRYRKALSLQNETTELDPKESYYIHGKSGIGKTHMICSLIQDLILTSVLNYEKGNKVYYQSIPVLLQELRNSYSNKNKIQSLDKINRILDYEYLFLDDLGCEKITDWSSEIIYSIIDHRYNQLQHFTITSNINLPELVKLTDERIVRRIEESCIIIHKTKR